MDDPVIGIDLGTTNSAVGVVEAGFPMLLANEEGERLVPSVVWYGPAGKVVVGRAAVRETGEGRAVRSAKRQMGLRFGEAGEGSLPLQASEDGGVAFTLQEGQAVTPVEVAAEVLKELRRIAEFRLETPVRRAVITVPAYFNNAQRAATKLAGEMAGLEVLRLVAEPTAAALSYGMDKLNDCSRVVVFDLGGGTFDVSLLELREGVFEVFATGGDTWLGGDDFDAALVAEIGRRAGLEKRAARRDLRLLNEAERVKCELSTREQSTFRVPFYEGSSSLEEEFGRGDFEVLLGEQFARMRRICREVLVDAKVESAEIEAVVLVGGSTRMPAVQRLVAEVFGKEPDCSQHPEEAVALGAAIQAGILAGTWRNVLLLDVTPLSLGIETLGGLMNVLIPRNTTIPCKAGEMFTNARDGQDGMRVRVLQGERELAKDNWELGEFDIQFQPSPRGKARVGVQFSLDENGILEVLARDVEGGHDVVVAIESAAVDVCDEAVEQMVGESVEHAFEDMNARIFTEARLKAEELLPAVAEALREFGKGMEEAERGEIEAAKLGVEEALQGESAAGLKEAVEQLDRATEALAARLVEQALAARFGGKEPKN
jgi:molecular chaperone DnaK